METSDVLLGRRWPSLRERGTSRLRRPLEGDDELLAILTLKVDDSMRVRDLLLLGDEVGVELGIAESALQLGKRNFWERLRVLDEALLQMSVASISLEAA